MANLVVFVFFPQEPNKEKNSTPSLQAINIGIFIRPTNRMVGVANLEQHKTKTTFIWILFDLANFQYIISPHGEGQVWNAIIVCPQF